MSNVGVTIAVKNSMVEFSASGFTFTRSPAAMQEILNELGPEENARQGKKIKILSDYFTHYFLKIAKGAF